MAGVIWDTLSKPIFALAPMEDVTDTVFRQIVAKAAGPDLLFTEFVNVEGLRSAGRKRIDHRLKFTPQEGNVIVQIWGRNPESFYVIAQELADDGYVGIDLNMGCPDRSVVRRGECSGLINNPSLAQEIIAATKEGAGELPVSVKTRCGVNQWVTEEWVGFLLQQNIAALTLHGRIAKEMSHFPARWEEIGKAVEIRNTVAPRTKILGNGDVSSYQDGLDKVETYGVDGVMVGRGIFANPWIFAADGNAQSGARPRLELLRDHLRLWQRTWAADPTVKPLRNFEAMKKFYKMYLRDFDEAAEMRAELMQLHSVGESIEEVNQLLEKV